jgi:hypothetical protein
MRHIAPSPEATNSALGETHQFLLGVADLAGAVGEEHHVDALGIAGQGLVDAVVDDGRLTRDPGARGARRVPGSG